MSKVRFQLSVSLDGYSAGPNQSKDEPLGVGGEQLHEWMFPLAAWRKTHGESGGEHTPSSDIVDEFHKNVGAYVMGRNMFGGGPGPWRDDPPWKGWWGDDPPYHAPVFVLTHHPRAPLEMEGGTTFYFVTDGIASALEQAKKAADGKDVLIAGGAKVVQQSLRAGAVDEFTYNISPIVLGAGERLLDNVGDLKVEQVRVIDAPGVTHIRYRVVR